MVLHQRETAKVIIKDAKIRDVIVSLPPEDSDCARFPLSPTGFVSNKVFQVPRERTKQWPFSVALPSKCPTVKISSDGIELVPAVNGCDFHAHYEISRHNVSHLHYNLPCQVVEVLALIQRSLNPGLDAKSHLSASPPLSDLSSRRVNHERTEHNNHGFIQIENDNFNRKKFG